MLVLSVVHVLHMCHSPCVVHLSCVVHVLFSMLYIYPHTSPSPHITITTQTRATALHVLRTEFLEACDKELDRVDAFFQQKHAELLQQCSKVCV